MSWDDWADDEDSLYSRWRQVGGWILTGLLTLGLVVALGGVFLGSRRAADLQQQVDATQQRLDRLHRRNAELRRSVTEISRNEADMGADLGEVAGDVAVLVASLARLDAGLQAQIDRTLDTRAVAATADPSVVVVECEGSQGSGFVVDPGGTADVGTSTVVTNHHVVEGCVGEDAPAPVVRQESTRFPNQLVTWDADVDLALLEIAATLPGLSVADSPEPGDPVLAVGAPLGLEHSYTDGVFSAVEDTRFFRHSADINPGNSGGPLLDRRGEVLGVNTQKIFTSPDGRDVQGIGLAVRMGVVCQTVLTC